MSAIVLYTNSKAMGKKVCLTLALMAAWTVALAQFSNVKKGDIIELDGQKAIVWQVDESGEHGCAMGVKPLRGVDDAWCKNKKVADRLPKMDNDNDGMANTKALIDFVKRENLKMADFPAFDWCSKLGPEWFIPSVKELEGFINFWLGNEQEMDWDIDDEAEQTLEDDKPYYKQINVKMLDAGGISFINGVFTSSLDAEGKVYVFSCNRNNNTWKFSKRSPLRVGKMMVARAFRKF